MIPLSPQELPTPKQITPAPRGHLAAIAFLAGFLPLVFPSLLLAAQLQRMCPHPHENLQLFWTGVPLYQFPSKLDGGGNLSVFTMMLDLEVNKQVTDRLGAGVSITYIFDDYRFSGLTSFRVSNPWNAIHTAGFAAPLFYSLNEACTWNLTLIPTIQYAGEGGARFGDALSYGGVVGLSRVIGPNLELGLGLGAYYNLAAVSVYPYPIVKFKLGKGFNFTSPFIASPAGPAGGDLSYSLNDHWDIGVGGAYRSYRFRLNYRGPIPNGIGNYRSCPLFARVAYTQSDAFKAEFYAGVSLFNKIYIDDRKGNEFYRSNQKVAPLIGLSISGTL
jgi:hypothetical protein